jgi:hypothetical protein
VEMEGDGMLCMMIEGLGMGAEFALPRRSLKLGVQENRRTFLQGADLPLWRTRHRYVQLMYIPCPTQPESVLLSFAITAD